jgi:hypothetical protein
MSYSGAVGPGGGGDDDVGRTTTCISTGLKYHHPLQFGYRCKIYSYIVFCI